MEKKETISRGQFIRDLGLSSATLMAFYCMGTTMTGCTNSTPDPAPVTPPAGNSGLTGNALLGQGAINFTLDLTSDNYKKLKTEGEFLIVGDVIVANAKGNKLIALAKACTHQGTTVVYRPGSDDLWCSNHGSVFNTNGSVNVSPASSPLTAQKRLL